MPQVVAFGFAVADGLVPAVGAAPWDVLARQLPRLLVARLNGGGDQGARYFPFLATADGKRQFMTMHALLQPEQLLAAHRQEGVRILVDGLLDCDGIHWRIFAATTGELLRQTDLPFDARQPLAPLARLEFEVGDALGWNHLPAPSEPLVGEALGWWLIVKDTALSIEAGMLEPDGHALRPAHKLLELARESARAHDTVLELAALVARRSRGGASLCALLHTLTPHLEANPDRLEHHAAIAQAIGLEEDAATSLARAARVAPDRRELAERAASMLFAQERLGELKALLLPLRAGGHASVTAIAQLAAAADRLGDQPLKAELTEELLRHASVPVAVARLVVSFLLEESRATEARTLAERTLAVVPGHGMLQFELGRACLMLGDDQAAASALNNALQLGVSPRIEPQARRLRRLASTPGLWADLRAAERAITANDLTQALRMTQALAQRVGECPETHYLMGLIRHRLGQPRRAMRLLQQALLGDEQFADAHNRLGALLVARGKVSAGCEHLQRAHELAPDEPSPLLHLAQAYGLLGRIAEANEHLSAAVRRGAAPALVESVKRALRKHSA